MDPQTQRILEQGGVDAADALERFMGKTELMERFMKRFLADENFAALEQALKAEDQQEAIRAAHALKGTSGNLSLTALHQRVTDQLALLRADDLAGAVQAMDGVAQAYAAATDAIRQAFGEG